MAAVGCRAVGTAVAPRVSAHAQRAGDHGTHRALGSALPLRPHAPAQCPELLDRRRWGRVAQPASAPATSRSRRMRRRGWLLPLPGCQWRNAGPGGQRGAPACAQRRRRRVSSAWDWPFCTGAVSGVPNSKLGRCASLPGKLVALQPARLYFPAARAILSCVLVCGGQSAPACACHAPPQGPRPRSNNKSQRRLPTPALLSPSQRLRPQSWTPF